MLKLNIQRFNYGTVVIGTEIDTSGFEKGLKKIENSNDEDIQINAIFNSEQIQKEIDRIADQFNKNFEINADTSSFNAQILEVETKLLSLKTILQNAQSFGLDSQDVIEYTAKIEELNNKLTTLNKKQDELNNQGMNNLKKAIDDIGQGMENTIRKVSKWALALIGIRSAYVGIRRAISLVSSENEGISSQINVMKSAIANALLPLVQTILNVIAKIMMYINYLFKALTGKELFNFSKAFKDVQKSSAGTAKNMKSSAKSAKEINKQTSSFDEMNVLSDNKSSSGDGGGAGGTGEVGTAKIENPFKDWESFKPPGWLKTIADNINIIVAGIAGLAGAIAALKIMSLLSKLGLLTKGIKGLMALGIGVAIAGLVLLIQDVIDFIKDPSWEKFNEILYDLSIILAGVALAMIAFNATNPVGWIMLAISAVVALVATIIKYWDEISAFLSGVAQWIYDNVIKPIVDFFVGLWNTIVDIFTPIIDFFANIFDTIFTNIGIFINNIKEIISALWNAIKNILGPIFNWIYDKIIKPIADKIKLFWEKLKSGFKTAVDTIKNIFTPIVNFFKGIIDKIKSILVKIATTVGDIISGAFKGVVNGVLGAIEKILNFPIRAINKLINTINKIPGIDLDKLKEFELPRLAKGGIINQPGKGVMLGSAIGGERGKEGVIPLTDSQQMALLGEAIGKYITVNANITNTMNGRVISRSLQQIKNDDDFAYNR
jgi:phage-related protein